MVFIVKDKRKFEKQHTFILSPFYHTDVFGCIVKYFYCDNVKTSKGRVEMLRYIFNLILQKWLLIIHWLNQKLGKTNKNDELTEKQIRHFHPYYQKDIAWNLLQVLQAKDIVFAIMPLPYTQLKKIKKGHAIRPYIIAKKEGEYIYGYYGTSKQTKSKNAYMLSQETYQFRKNSSFYINHYEKIHYSHLVGYAQHVSNKDAKKINDLIKSQNKQSLPTLPIEYDSIQKGDVLQIKKQMAYVLEAKDQVLKIIYLNQTNGFSIIFQKKIYHLDFQQVACILTSSAFQKVGQLSVQYQQLIDQKWMKSNVQSTSIQAGDVVCHKKQYFYVEKIVEDCIHLLPLTKKYQQCPVSFMMRQVQYGVIFKPLIDHLSQNQYIKEGCVDLYIQMKIEQLKNHQVQIDNQSHIAIQQTITIPHGLSVRLVPGQILRCGAQEYIYFFSTTSGHVGCMYDPHMHSIQLISLSPQVNCTHRYLEFDQLVDYAARCMYGRQYDWYFQYIDQHFVAI